MCIVNVFDAFHTTTLRPKFLSTLLIAVGHLAFIYVGGEEKRRVQWRRRRRWRCGGSAEQQQRQHRPTFANGLCPPPHPTSLFLYVCINFLCLSLHFYHTSLMGLRQTAIWWLEEKTTAASRSTLAKKNQGNLFGGAQTGKPGNWMFVLYTFFHTRRVVCHEKFYFFPPPSSSSSSSSSGFLPSPFLADTWKAGLVLLLLLLLLSL